MTMTETTLQQATRNRHRTATLAALGAVAMIGVSFAAVPLYDLFCRVTGYGGTTQVSEGNPKGLIDRQMTVRFDSTVGGDLAWTVTPARSVTDRVGTVETVNYIAINHADHPVTGHAIFNVAPPSAGIYFNKIECFCFTEQTLQPGERVEMPVTFFVDPDIADQRELDTIREITLSYTFYAQNAEEI